MIEPGTYWIPLRNSNGDKLPPETNVQLRYEDGYICDLKAGEVNWQDKRDIHYKVTVGI